MSDRRDGASHPGPHPQSPMRSALHEIASKGIVYGLGASFNGLVSFTLIPFFTHRLTAAEYGRFAIAEVVLNLILVLLGLGMNVAILARYPSVPPEERRRFFGGLLSFMLVAIVVLEAAFLMLALRWGTTIASVLDMRMFYLIAAISAIETIWLVFATLYRAEGRAWRYIGASVFQASAGLVATVWLIRRLGYRDDGILIGRLMGDAALLAIVLLPQMMRYSFGGGLSTGKDLLRIGLPLIPATFSSMWVLTSPRYLIEWYGSVADVGVYAMSSKLAGVIQILFIQPFAMAWMVSLFTIYRRPDAGRIYARVLTYYIVLGTTFALALGPLGRVVVPVLAHQRFPLSTGIMLVVALAQVAAGLMYPLNIGPYVLEETRKMTPVFVASSVLITILGIVLVRRWG